MTTREALAAALKAEGFVRGVASRFGRFNDVYYESCADAILTALPPADRHDHEPDRCDECMAMIEESWRV